MPPPRHLPAIVLAALLLAECSSATPLRSLRLGHSSARAAGADRRVDPGVVRVEPVQLDLPLTFETLQASNDFMFYLAHIPKTGGRTLHDFFRRPNTKPSGIKACAQVWAANYRPDAGGRAGRGCPTRQTTNMPPGENKTFCYGLVERLKGEVGSSGRYQKCNFITFETLNMTEEVTQHLTMPRLKPLTILREPVSHYMSQFLHDKAARRVSTLEEYLTKENKAGYNNVVNGNYQLRCLGARSVAEGKRILSEQMFFFGVLEHWQTSICLLKYQLGQFDRTQCDLCEAHDGVKTSWIGHRTAAEERASTLDVSLVKQMQRINRLDSELYTWAMEEFKGRVRQVEQKEGVRMLCNEATPL